MTIEELKSLFEKYGYIIDDELLHRTLCNINHINDNNEITAIGLFGPSGTGKTRYAKVYSQILSDVLKTNITLITSICNYNRDDSNIEDTNDVKLRIIDKKHIIEAINRANDGEKVILLIDGYDEIDNLTDKFLANFLESGIIYDKNEAIKLDKKENLQVIITGTNGTNLYDTLATRLDIIKRNYFTSWQVLSHLETLNKESNILVNYLISYIYFILKLKKNDFELLRLPSISQLTQLSKDIAFLINNNTPLNIMYGIIYEKMIISAKNKKKIMEEKAFESLESFFNKDKVWNNEEVMIYLINRLNSNYDFEKLLINKIKDIPLYKERLIKEEKKVPTLIDNINGTLINLETFSRDDFFVNDGSGVDKNGIRNKFDLSNHLYKDILPHDERSVPQFKIAQISKADISKFYNNKINYIDTKTGPIIYQSLFDGKYYNRLSLCRERILGTKVADYIIYSSDPVLSYGALQKLFYFFETIEYTYSTLNIGFLNTFFDRGRYKDDYSYYDERIIYDNLYPQLNYISSAPRSKESLKGFINEIIKKHAEINVLKNSYPNDFSYIIPTHLFFDNQVQPSKEITFDKKRYRTNRLQLGKIWFQVYKYASDNPKDLSSSIVNKMIKDIYNNYTKDTYGHDDNKYDYDHLYVTIKPVGNYRKEPLTTGVYVVNPKSDEEFLLVNPYELCLNNELYYDNLKDANEKVLKMLNHRDT